MIRRTLLAASVGLASCGPELPAVGDVYTNRMTDARVGIGAVGPCEEVSRGDYLGAGFKESMAEREQEMTEYDEEMAEWREAMESRRFARSRLLPPPPPSLPGSFFADGFNPEPQLAPDDDGTLCVGTEISGGARVYGLSYFRTRFTQSD